MDKKSLLIITSIVILSGLMGGVFSFFLVTLPVAGRVNSTTRTVLENIETLRPTIAQVTPTATPSAVPTRAYRSFQPVIVTPGR